MYSFTRIEKLERLLRKHRQRVFDENTFIADLHHKKLLRLKRTQTFADMARRNENETMVRHSESLLRTYA